MRLFPVLNPEYISWLSNALGREEPRIPASARATANKAPSSDRASVPDSSSTDVLLSDQSGASSREMVNAQTRDALIAVLTQLGELTNVETVDLAQQVLNSWLRSHSATAPMPQADTQHQQQPNVEPQPQTSTLPERQPSTSPIPQTDALPEPQSNTPREQQLSTSQAPQTDAQPQSLHNSPLERQPGASLQPQPDAQPQLKADSSQQVQSSHLESGGEESAAAPRDSTPLSTQAPSTHATHDTSADPLQTVPSAKLVEATVLARIALALFKQSPVAKLSRTIRQVIRSPFAEHATARIPQTQVESETALTEPRSSLAMPKTVPASELSSLSQAPLLKPEHGLIGHAQTQGSTIARPHVPSLPSTQHTQHGLAQPESNMQSSTLIQQTGSLKRTDPVLRVSSTRGSASTEAADHAPAASSTQSTQSTEVLRRSPQAGPSNSVEVSDHKRPVDDETVPAEPRQLIAHAHSSEPATLGSPSQVDPSSSPEQQRAEAGAVHQQHPSVDREPTSPILATNPTRLTTTAQIDSAPTATATQQSTTPTDLAKAGPSTLSSEGAIAAKQPDAASAYRFACLIADARTASSEATLDRAAVPRSVDVWNAPSQPDESQNAPAVSSPGEASNTAGLAEQLRPQGSAQVNISRNPGARLPGIVHDTSQQSSLPSVLPESPVQQLLNLCTETSVPLYIEAVVPTQAGNRPIAIVIDEGRDRLDLTGQQSTSVHLSLKTENLGSVSVDLTHNQGISCLFGSTEESADLIQGALPELRDRLTEAGLRVLLLSSRPSAVAHAISTDSIGSQMVEGADKNTPLPGKIDTKA